ncbi:MULTISPECIES: cytochrome c-type biogenesis protein [Henriciella]|jgi:cytochrome c-type biogenesis protein CcmH|uniref:Cytochrome c-type biogenesis protein n=1 Tax=Henriciella pelagia TaxID=1977912 RepID=A0ABQ1J414_9PROT|nr:cytochrome c-type biogenesis protein [Henriciella pelagia]GGB56898.1 hypothetical protein GCM10011503_01560 [Henriciella pelagia]
MKLILASLLFLFAAEGQLADPDQEARAQDLMREIRCVACENEPISNSGSDIAADMRERVRTMIADGASDDEVRDWFSERYGEFVLFRPSSKGFDGLLLWGLPFILLVGGAALILAVRSRKASDANAIKPVPPEDV